MWEHACDNVPKGGKSTDLQLVVREIVATSPTPLQDLGVGP